MDSRDKTINNELFRLYNQYLLCQVKRSSSSRWNNNEVEKKALVDILTLCQNVDGNTLRIIMDQIFEHSVDKFGFNFNAAITNTQNTTGESQTNTLNKIPRVIASPDDEDDDEESDLSMAEEDDYQEPEIIPVEVIKPARDGAVISKNNIIPSKRTRIEKKNYSPQPSPSPKPRAPTRRRAPMEPRVPAGTVLTNFHTFLSNVEEAHRLFKIRSQALNNSFTINHSTEELEEKGPSNVFEIHDIDHEAFGCDREMVYKCQANFVAFRFHKMSLDLRELYPKTDALKIERRYHQELQNKMNINGSGLYAYSFLPFENRCRSVDAFVSQYGFYTLLIPDVLPTSRLFNPNPKTFESVFRLMNEKCAVFKKIVRADSGGMLTFTDQD